MKADVRLVVLAGAILLTMAAGLAEGVDASAGPIRYTEGCGLSEPQVVEKAAPVYPEQARKERIQGTVVLDVVVQTDGSVGGVEVVEAAHELLDAAAKDAVGSWRYVPAKDAEGRPVAVLFRVTVVFRLS